MKKNLVLRLVPLIALAACFNSCSIEEDYLSKKDEKYSKRFQTFSANKDKTINYGEGFKTLLERYDNINNVQHTVKALKKAWSNSAKMSDEYIELNIRSQDITTKNNEVYTLFPFIKNYMVSGIIIAVLREDNTIVEFLKMSPEAENYSQILELFRTQYEKSILQVKGYNNIGAKGSCGFNGSPPCSIDPIIINMPRGGGGSLPPGDGGSPSGGCSPYVDCFNLDDGGEGGGDNSPDPPQNNNPCEQTENMLTDPKVKAKIDDLKTKTTGAVENAYKFKTDGTPSNLIVGEAHKVNFGDKTGYQGGYHNHRTGIPMLSPPDIEQLLQFALAQGNYGNPSSAYVGMVAPNSMHYVILFNGNYQDALVTFSQDDIEKYKIQYLELSEVLLLDSQYSTDHLNLNNKGVETLLFDTLKNMGLEGKVNLQRIEGSEIIKSINLDDNNQPIPTPC